VTRAAAKRDRALKRAEKAGATLKPISETVAADTKPAPAPDPLEFPKDDDSPG
jgi:hypothetical protein